MDIKIKKRWLAALRGGKFKQGKRALRTEKGYCCLGVLCELHRRSVGGKWINKGENGGWEYLDYCGTLPDQVVNWAGLTGDNPRVNNTHGPALAEVNDTTRRGFRGIANLIEKWL